MKLCTLLQQYNDDMYFKVEEVKTKKIKGVGKPSTLLGCLETDILNREVMLCVPVLGGQIYRLVIRQE